MDNNENDNIFYYQYDDSEYLKNNAAVSRYNYIYKKHMIRYTTTLIIGLVVAAFVTALLIYTLEPDKNGESLIRNIMLIAYIMFVFLYAKKTPKKLFDEYKKNNVIMYDDKYSVEFQQDYLIERTKRNESRYFYKYIYKAIVLNDKMLICLGASNYIPVYYKFMNGRENDVIQLLRNAGVNLEYAVNK